MKKSSIHNEFYTLMVCQSQGQIFVSSTQKPLYNIQTKYILEEKKINQKSNIQNTIEWE